MKLVIRRPYKSAKQVPHYQSIQSIFDSSSSEASLISSCAQKLWLAWACHASPQGSTVAWWPTFPRLLQRKLWGQALHLRRMITELLSECIVSGQTTKAAWSKRSSTALAIALSNLFIAKQEEIQLINGKNWVVKAAKTSGGRIYCEASLLAGISCLIKMTLAIDNIDTPQERLNVIVLFALFTLVQLPIGHLEEANDSKAVPAFTLCLPHPGAAADAAFQITTSQATWSFVVSLIIVSVVSGAKMSPQELCRLLTTCRRQLRNMRKMNVTRHS